MLSLWQRNPNNYAEPLDNRLDAEALVENDLPARDVDVVEEEEFLDVENFNDFEAAHANSNVDFTKLARNCFFQADKIHRANAKEEEIILDFDDLSSEKEELDATPILEEVLQ